MVVVGTRRGGGEGVDQVKVFSAAWQRQHDVVQQQHHHHHHHHHHHQQQHYAQHQGRAGVRHTLLAGEALPVVELRPFTRKVWRRERSVPALHSSPPHRDDQPAESARAARAPASPPSLARVLHELSEQRHAVITRHSAPSTQRCRSQLHPKAHFSVQAWGPSSPHPPHPHHHLIPSFSSRRDRARSSLGEEAGGGGGPEDEGTAGRQSSSLLTAYTRDKALQQEAVCVTGDRLTVGGVGGAGGAGRHPLSYLHPYSSSCRQRQAWSVMRLENSPTGLGPDPDPPRHVSLSLLTPTTTPLSPGPDGCGNPQQYPHQHPHTHPHQHLVLAGSSLQAADSLPPHTEASGHSSLRKFHSALGTGISREGSPHKFHSALGTGISREGSPHKFHSALGAAQDSLTVLSRSGAPTVVERHLSFHQDVRLQRCRRERSFAAVTAVGVLSSAHYVAFDSHPTPGEVLLRQARHANRSRDGSKADQRSAGPNKLSALSGVLQQGGGLSLGRVADHSPRSLQSQAGDSVIVTSPGQPPEDPVVMTPAGQPDHDPRGPSRLTVVLPLHGSEPQRREENGADHSHGLQVWGGQLGEGAGQSLEEPADDQHRPRSDTAVTETVHLRNELTAMSADNRARLLPRHLPSLAPGELPPHCGMGEGRDDRDSEQDTVYDDCHSSASSLSTADRAARAWGQGGPPSLQAGGVGREGREDTERQAGVTAGSQSPVSGLTRAPGRSPSAGRRPPVASSEPGEGHGPALSDQQVTGHPDVLAHGHPASAGHPEPATRLTQTPAGPSSVADIVSPAVELSVAPADPSTELDDASLRAVASVTRHSHDQDSVSGGPQPLEATATLDQRQPRPRESREGSTEGVTLPTVVPVDSTETRETQEVASDGKQTGEADTSTARCRGEVRTTDRETKAGHHSGEVEHSVSVTSEGDHVTCAGDEGGKALTGVTSGQEHSPAGAATNGPRGSPRPVQHDLTDLSGHSETQPALVIPADTTDLSAHSDTQPALAIPADSTDLYHSDKDRDPPVAQVPRGVEAMVTVTMDTGETGDDFEGRQTFLTTSNVETSEHDDSLTSHCPQPRPVVT